METSVTNTRFEKIVTGRSERAVILIIQDQKQLCGAQGAFLSSDEARKIAAELVRYAEEADAVPVATDEERKIILDHFRTHGKFLKIEDIRVGK